MIDPTRRELLRLLEELSAVCPEYRFGQMILNLAFLAREDGDLSAWDIQDAELVAAARKHRDDWYASHGDADDRPEDDPRLRHPIKTARPTIEEGHGGPPEDLDIPD